MTTEDNKFSNSIDSKESKELINKGTGAGGKNTNKNGLKFENITSIVELLIQNNFTKIVIGKGKNDYIYRGYINDMEITYVTKRGFSCLMQKEFLLDKKNLYKEPDEAFIILRNNKYYLKIIEKKYQRVPGSAEDKIKNAIYIRDIEYKKNLNNKFTEVDLSYCVNKYLYKKLNCDKKKYIDLKEYLELNRVTIFCGDSKDYLKNIFNKYITNI
jgi:hypothetical protein